MSRRTSLSKTEIATKIRKIDHRFCKWYQKKDTQVVSQLPWKKQKKFLTKQLINENLLGDYQLKTFWKAFDAACEIIPSDWKSFQLPLMRILIYLANEKTI